jgi:lambda repressor-like predicted transcriptional regulator
MRHRSTIGKIRLKLFEAGIKTAYIDRQFNLYAGQANDALFEPNEAGEKAIAKALNTTPQALWPHRFNKRTGERLSPQPRTNYRPRKTVRQRQKAMAA